MIILISKYFFNILILLVIGFFYRKIWIKFFSSVQTPTGFGYFLILYLMFYSFYYDLRFFEKISLILIFIFASIYLIDDFIGLRPAIRVLLILSVGFILPIIIIDPRIYYNEIIYLVYICICLSIFNFLITNVINFYDGSDLNIALLISTVGILLYIYSNNDTIGSHLGIILTSFIIPFILYNYKPNYLYFGDSGCFIFSNILLILLILNINNRNTVPIETFVPIILPLIDVIYVLFLRIKKKHNLLSRNYLHLYQKLNIKYQNYLYLLPQITNTFICLVIIYYLKINSFDNLIFILVSCFFSTILFYSMCRKFLLKKEVH